jgi:hypothetical protein
MEQGPVLEALGVPLAPVAAIAGQTRLHVSIHGVQVRSMRSVLVQRPRAGRQHRQTDRQAGRQMDVREEAVEAKLSVPCH